MRYLGGYGSLLARVGSDEVSLMRILDSVLDLFGKYLESITVQILKADESSGNALQMLLDCDATRVFNPTDSKLEANQDIMAQIRINTKFF